MRRKSTFLFRKKVQPNGADWCGGRQQGDGCDIPLKSDPKYNQTAQTSADTRNRTSAAKVLYCIKSKKINQTAQIGAKGGNRVTVCDIQLKSDPKYNQTAQTSAYTCNRSSAAKVLHYCIKSKKINQTAQIGAKGGNRVTVCDIQLKSDPKYNQTAQTSAYTCNRSSAAKVLHYCIKSKK